MGKLLGKGRMKAGFEPRNLTRRPYLALSHPSWRDGATYSSLLAASLLSPSHLSSTVCVVSLVTATSPQSWSPVRG